MPAPDRDEGVLAVITHDVPAVDAAPAAPAVTNGASARMLARLPIHDDRIPGTHLRRFALPDSTYCGGVSVHVLVLQDRAEDVDRRTALEPMPASDDRAFELAMTLAMTNVYQITRDPDAGLAAANFFHLWATVAMRAFTDANAPLRSYVTAPDPTDLRKLLVTFGRLVQLERRTAELFTRAEIPMAFDVEPARTAWCDSLATQVEGLLDLADQDADMCRRLATKGGQHGTWDDACAPSSP